MKRGRWRLDDDSVKKPADMLELKFSTFVQALKAKKVRWGPLSFSYKTLADY